MPFRTPAAAAFTSSPQGMSSRAPMFGSAPEAPLPNPLQGMPGMGNAGMMMQMFMPLLMQQVGNRYGMVPGQFAPSQNLFDQFQAQQYHQQQAAAMTRGQMQDQQQLQQMIQGFMRTQQSTPLTRQQQQQAHSMAGQAQQLIPIMSQVLGPEMVDQMLGGRSSTIMTQSIHRGMRFRRDVASGAGQTSGHTAGFVGDEMFERLYGSEAKPGAMAGISAGSAGALFEELQARGLIRGGGTTSERFAEVAHMDFSRAQQRRMAESELRAQGREVNEENMRSMQASMFDGPGSTLGRIQGGQDSTATLKGLAGGDTFLRAGDAVRMAKQVENMSGAVRAMRDIFGDMGNPDAPMAELVAGLDALTQGKFATMSPAAVEQMVRTTRNLAQASGMGMQALMGLSSAIAGQTDALGGSRAAVPFLTQQAAAASIGFENAGMNRITGEGALTRQQATLLEGRLGAGAAASQQANAQFAILRMKKELGDQLDPNSKLAAVAKAIEEGSDKVTYKDPRTGKMVTENLADMQLSNGDVADMAAASGINRDVARSYLANRTGNADMINTAGGRNAIRNTRERQLRQDLNPVLAQAFAAPMFSMLNDETAAGQALAGAGVRLTHEDRMRMADQMVTDFFNMDTATQADDKKRTEAMRGNARKAIEDTARKQLRDQGVPEAEIEDRIRKLRGTITDDMLDQMARGQFNLGDAAIATGAGGKLAGLKGMKGAFQALSPEAQRQKGQAQFEQENKAQVQSAFSGINAEGPMARIVNAIKDAKPGEDLGRIAAKALGFVDQKEIDAVMETGGLRAIKDIQELGEGTTTLTGEAMRDEAGNLTEAGKRNQELLAQLAQGMTKGGDLAGGAMDALAKEFGVENVGEVSKIVEGRLGDKNLSESDRKRYERIKRIIGVTQGAREGETLPKMLEKIKAKDASGPGGGEKPLMTEGVAAADGQSVLGQLADFGKSLFSGAGSEAKQTRASKMAVSGELRIVGLDKALLMGEGATGDFENNGVQTQVIAPGTQSS